MLENPKHKAIDETFSQRIDELLYSKTDEKVIASELLRKIFSGRKFTHALDVGAGPGEITKPLADISENLTIVELLPEYRKILAGKFPKAKIITNSIDNVPLKQEYDLILFSQVLMYFPHEEWFGLVEKLHNALLPNGELIIILLADSGDWWKIVDRFWKPLRQFIRFDYIPLSEFKKTLSQLGDLRVYPYTSQILCDSKDVAIECIGREILQINDEEILKKFRSEFAKIASDLEQRGDKTIIDYESEIIVIRKN